MYSSSILRTYMVQNWKIWKTLTTNIEIKIILNNPHVKQTAWIRWKHIVVQKYEKFWVAPSAPKYENSYIYKSLIPPFKISFACVLTFHFISTICKNIKWNEINLYILCYLRGDVGCPWFDWNRYETFTRRRVFRYPTHNNNYYLISIKVCHKIR